MEADRADRVVPAQRAAAGDDEEHVRHQVDRAGQEILQEAALGRQRLYGLEGVEQDHRLGAVLTADQFQVPPQQDRQVGEHLVGVRLIEDEAERRELALQPADVARPFDRSADRVDRLDAATDHTQPTDETVQHAERLVGELGALLGLQQAGPADERGQRQAGMAALPVHGQRRIEAEPASAQSGERGPKP
jgi:hypothetical protein